MAVTIKTLGTQLEEVQIAISKVMAGQRSELNGRSMWRPDLEFLHQREKDLGKAIAIYGIDGTQGSSVSRQAVKVSFIDG